MPPCPFCLWNPDVTLTKVGTLMLIHEYPSQNALGSNTRGGGWKYRKLRDGFITSLRNVSRLPAATGPRQGVITRQYRPRCRDYDYGNLVGGGKPLIDALKTCGLILDDSPKQWTGWYRQVAGSSDLILITLYEQP